MLTNDNFLHPADNFVMTQWTRLSDTSIFNQVPFGVYAFTQPMDKVSSNDILPFMLEEVIYFGKAGSSYDGFFFDRKTFNPLTNKASFTKYSPVHKRLKSHRYYLSRNTLDDRETCYQKFYDIFGCATDEIISKMNVCVIVPKVPIEDFQVASWCLFIESYFIFLYQQRFGRNTLMNMQHKPSKGIEGSHASIKKKEVNANSLMAYL